MSVKNKGWQVVLAAVGINLLLGVLYSWGVISKELQNPEGWGWSRPDASLPMTVSTMTFAVMMIFAGRMQDKLGPRLVAALGGCMLGGGLILSAHATSPLWMVLGFGVIGGSGIGLGYSATTPSAIKWFPPARKGMITGIVVSGIGLSAIYMAPLADWMLRQWGIKQTLLILGVGTIVLVVGLAQLLVNPPAGYVVAAAPANARSAQGPAAGHAYDWHEMIRTTQFIRLWLMFSFAAAAGLMLIAHVAMIAKEQVGLAWGFVFVALLAIFNTCGRLLAGWLSDRVGRSRTMVLMFAGQALNMFLFRFYDTQGLLLMGTALTGLCYGGIFTLFPATTADYFGLKNLGVNYGLVFTAFGFASYIGVMIPAQLAQRFGTYHLAYLMAGGLLVAATLIALTLRAPAARPERQPAMARVG